MMATPIKIIVVCTGNSCRSQIAEGFLRFYAKDQNIIVQSAGVGKMIHLNNDLKESHGLNPNAVEVMKEIGIDISHHTSKTLQQFKEDKFDYAITVCDDTQNCPYVPFAKHRIHAGFPDPAKFKSDDKQQVLVHFREVRDQISKYCEQFIHDNFNK